MLETIPADLLPRDGRFGSGPSKIRDLHLEALRQAPAMGTSHRQAPVRHVVRSIREGLTELFSLPPGFEVALGNGGSTAFWDMAAFSLVRRRAAHWAFGEFGSKFAEATQGAPFLEPSHILSSAPGTLPDFTLAPPADCDVLAWPHNETSTGVRAPLLRPGPALTVVDGTSAAGGMEYDPDACDVYYFAPQKNFGSDGGLWLALLSPAAVERVGEIKSTGRWIPTFLDLSTALDNSRQNQTYNTPAVGSLVLLNEQVRWMLSQGGLSWAAGRCRESSGIVYRWAEDSTYARPFVSAARDRSPVVCTVDFNDDVDASRVAAVLRAHGVVDVEPYRKLGRNQLRIATFVSIEPDDVTRLLACIDHVVLG